VLRFVCGIIRQDQEWPLPKDKDEARAEGFKRGVEGKSDAAGLTQGWTDDKVSGVARSEGWVAGKRKRSQLEAEAARKARTKK
jgi:hypothetical protein